MPRVNHVAEIQLDRDERDKLLERMNDFAILVSYVNKLCQESWQAGYRDGYQRAADVACDGVARAAERDRGEGIPEEEKPF